MRALLLLVLLSGLVRAGDSELQMIKSRIALFATLKGRFTQSKKIRVIKKPLKSEGNFVLLKDKGVLWRTFKPRVVSVRVFHDEIAEIKDGRPTVIVSAKDQPALGLIGKVLFAVFSADIKELKRHFDFTRAALKDPGGWEVSLRPRDAMIAKVIDGVEAAGTGTVESLTIHEVNGDVTSISFSEISSTRPVTTEEAALFE